MDNTNISRFPVNPRQLQPASLSALADDASSLAAAQQAPGDPTETAHSTFQHYQSSTTENQHPVQNVNPNDTPGFIRPPRPGEPTNNLLVAPQHHLTQQYQTASTLERQQQQLTNSNELRLKEASGTENHGRLGLMDRTDQLSPRNNSSVSSQLRSTPEMRLDMLQSTGGPSVQQTQQEPNFALAVDNVVKHTDLQKGMKLVPDPPDLNLWREKLFQVDEIITLSEDQYVFLFLSFSFLFPFLYLFGPSR